MKNIFLFLSRQKTLQKLLSTSGPFQKFSKRFVSGETLAEGVAASRELNQQGTLVTLDSLGESVQSEKDAREVVQEYLKIIEAVKAEDNFKLTVSLKLSQLGLAINDQFCLENIRQIMQSAKKHQKLVTIDMEDTPYTDQTLKIYRAMLKEGFKGTGIVLQSYLRRTEDDLRSFLLVGPRVRLCKGAYQEPAEVAFPKKSDVDKNYLDLLKILFSPTALKAGTYPEVATHDERIINWTIDYAKKQNITNDQFEFQMLYGIRKHLQEKLIRQGYQLRVYLPYGSHWYPYFMRRLAERPANVIFLMKGLFLR